MKKLIILGALLLSAIFVSGCGVQPIQPVTPPTENLTFTNESFSLKLPTPFTVSENNVINPKIEKDFPFFYFKVIKNTTLNLQRDILNKEDDKTSDLCTQTDACPKVLSRSEESISINGHDGIKFTVQTAGRNLGDTDGYLNTYTYIISNVTDVIEFQNYASDLEDLAQINKAFDSILNTISFKSPDIAATVPKDWKTYQNDEYAFSISYPSDFVINTTNGSTNSEKRILTLDLGTADYMKKFKTAEYDGPPLYLEVSAYEPKELSTKSDCVNGIQNGTTIVYGVSVPKCEWLELGSFPSISMSFTKDGVVHYSFESNTYSDSDKKLIDQIIDTFNLTK